MTVNTRKVQNRRSIRYASLSDLLRDAEKLAASNVRTLGNWSFGQILKHLAMSIDSSIDGTGFMLRAPVRWLMSLLMKKKFLTQPIPAGFKSVQQFIPNTTSVEEGLTLLRTAIERQQREPNRALHPAFGKLSNAEWDAFNLRHSELHMSFVVPN
ncbi:MAG: DUF1569 domain-containing protein [Planctomycetaceae bacterium]